MTRLSRVLFDASTLLLSFGCSGCYADANPERQATALLLQRYETVVSARSITLSRLQPDQSNQELGLRFLGLPFTYLMGGMKAIGPKGLATLEGGSDIVLTGAKDFVGPEGLGMVSSRSCYIAILKAGAALTLAKEFSKVKVAPLDGRAVWTWSIPPTSEGSKTPVELYAAVLTSSFFVLANDRNDFREMANALVKETGPAELARGRDLTSLRAHDYWAYRAIRRNDAKDAFASGLTALPVSATGLELFTDLSDEKLVFNILAPDSQSGSAPADLPSSESIRFRRAMPGVWQATIDLTMSNPASSGRTTAAVFRVMSYFGYGVAL
jgi:hypothetical protein